MITHLTNEVLKQMEEFGKTNQTEEICAILIGSRDYVYGKYYNVTEFHPIENILHSPVRYKFNPQEFMDIVQHTTLIDPEVKKDFVGVYHTHPNHRAIPSVIDIEESGYKGIYIIHSPIHNETNYYYVEGPKSAWIPVAAYHDLNEEEKHDRVVVHPV